MRRPTGRPRRWRCARDRRTARRAPRTPPPAPRAPAGTPRDRWDCRTSRSRAASPARVVTREWAPRPNERAPATQDRRRNGARREQCAPLARRAQHRRERAPVRLVHHALHALEVRPEAALDAHPAPRRHERHAEPRPRGARTRRRPPPGAGLPRHPRRAPAHPPQRRPAATTRRPVSPPPHAARPTNASRRAASTHTRCRRRPRPRAGPPRRRNRGSPPAGSRSPRGRCGAPPRTRPPGPTARRPA